jgi:hypothetical protein
MQKHLCLFIIAPLVICVGCAAEKSVTHIDSQPPGARIEVNEGVVGVTPCDVVLAQHGEHHRLSQRVIVKAYPPDNAQGQFKQEKFLVSQQEAPSRVLFLMTEPPPPPKP